MNELTARRLKLEYLEKLKEVVSEAKFAAAEGKEYKSEYIKVDALETKQKGRPLLLGKDLDVAVQEYVQSLRMADGIFNTLVIMAAAQLPEMSQN